VEIIQNLNYDLKAKISLFQSEKKFLKYKIYEFTTGELA